MYQVKKLYQNVNEVSYTSNFSNPSNTYSSKKPCSRKCNPYCDGFRC